MKSHMAGPSLLVIASLMLSPEFLIESAHASDITINDIVINTAGSDDDVRQDEMAWMSKQRESVDTYFRTQAGTADSGEVATKQYLNGILYNCTDGLAGFTYAPRVGLIMWQWRDLMIPGWNAPLPGFLPEIVEGVYDFGPPDLDEQATLNNVSGLAGYGGTVDNYSSYRFRQVRENNDLGVWSPWHNRGQRSLLEYPPGFEIQIVKENGAWTVDPKTKFNFGSSIIQGGKYSRVMQPELLQKFPSHLGALSDAACSNIVPGSSPPAPSANQAPATFGEWDKACKEHAPLLFPLAKRFLPTKTRAYESQLEFGGAPRTRACDEIVLDFFRERVCGNMFSYEEIKSTVFEIVVANRASPQLAISDISEGTRTRLDEWVEKYFEDTMRWAEFEGQGCALDGTEYGSDW